MTWTLLLNSLAVSVASTLLAVGIGFAVALSLAGLKNDARRFFLLAAILTMALPPFLVTNTWLHYLGNAGVWRSWLPVSILSFGGAIWILTLLNWPVTLLFVLAAWRKLEAAQLEVDPMLRGGALIRWLLWPMARNAVAQAAVITFVLCLNNFSVPAILQVRIFPEEIWVNFNTTFNYATALRLSWPLVFIPLFVLFWFREKKIEWPHRQSSVSPVLFRRVMGTGWSWGAGILMLMAIFFSIGLPLGQLFFSARTWNDLWPALEAGKHAVQYSILFASVTATFVVMAALGCWKWPLDLVAWISFLVPGVLLGIAAIYIFNRGPMVAFYQSVGIVFLLYTIRYLAPGWNVVARALRGVDPSLVDAARMEGAGAWQVFRHARWPQVSSSVAAAWYVTYLLCLWDVEALVLVVPPGCETLSLRVFNLLHYGHNSQVNAICFWLLVLAVLPFVIWGGLKRMTRLVCPAAGGTW